MERAIPILVPVNAIPHGVVNGATDVHLISLAFLVTIVCGKVDDIS